MRKFSPLPSLAATVIVGVSAALLASRPAPAQQFLANQIENLVSTDTMTVEIEGLSGALTGDIRIESVVVSDPRGTFLTAKNLAMDWSPLALVRSTVSIENLTAGQIVLERLPTGQPASEADQGSGFALPSITADIRNFAIAEFVLGEAIAGTRARLKASASLTLADDPTKLDVKANIDRLDQPGQIALDVSFAPDQNQLAIDVQASEPAGGLVATLLDIPDRPAVNLVVNGSGPLSDFMANGQLTVGGEQAATLTARVNDVADGRRLAASLNVAAERFVPEQYSQYVAGGASLDLQAVLRDDGTYLVEQGDLASEALALQTKGVLDPGGAGNDLTLAVASRDGSPISLSFGTPPDITGLLVTRLDGTVRGAFTAAAIDLSAKLQRAGYGDYVAQGLSLDASSPGFDLTGLKGPLAIEAIGQSIEAPEGIAERFLNGPLTVTANGALTETGFVFEPSEATTDVATLNLEGTAALNFAIFDLNLRSRFQTAALSAAAIPLAGEELSVAGQFTRAADGAINAQKLAVTGAGLQITGNAGLIGGKVSADIQGTLEDTRAVNPLFSGAAELRLIAKGPVEKPDIDLTLSGNGLSINGRELADLKVEVRGTLNPASPAGFVNITGTLDGQPLSGSAKVETLDNGDRRITDLAIRQGPNAVTGDLMLTDAFAPDGTLTVAIDDIGPLAALGGQKAAGDVKGTVELSIDAEKTPIAAPDLTSRSLTVAGTTLQGARIDLSVKDYLGIPRPTGRVTADAFDAAGVAVRGLALAFAEEQGGTGLTANATVNDAPIELAGTAQFEPDAMLLTLSRLAADIPNASVNLSDEAKVRIADGKTVLDGFVLTVGSGSIALEGSSGEVLDLALRLDDVPAAVANLFVSGLEVEGTVSGTATLTGAPENPDAAFAITGRELATAQVRAARIPPIALDATGRYVDGTLTLQTATLDLGEGSLQASGTIGETLDLRAELANLPVALANDFVDGLDTSGTISGSAVVSGTRADPVAVFDLAGTGITAAQVASAGIDPLTLDVAGRYAAGTATLERASLVVGSGSLEASGTIGDNLDLTLAMNDLPVALANGFVPDLNASGTISGTATATGSLTEPNAVFDLSGAGITTGAIARSGVAPLALRLAGRFADRTASLQTAVVNVGDGSLRASGKVGRELDLDLSMNNIPVGLANGFVPDLNASGTISGTATATGTLDDPSAEFSLTGSGITAPAIAQSGIEPLDLTAAGRLADGTVKLDEAKMAVGSGSLTANGTVGETLDLNIAANEIPVGLVNGFVPNLGATGTISGTATATGSLSDPRARFDLSGTGITTRQIAQSGVAPLSLEAAGSYANGTATIETADVRVGDGTLKATGTVGEALDLKIAVNQIPVGLANGFVDGLGATGTISGSAAATGSISDPQAEFGLTGSGITTRQIAQSGVAPLSLDLAGAYADGTATIDTANVKVGNGSLTASGTVGQTLDLKLKLDQLPVGLANGFVPDLNAEGTLSGTATATGSISDPRATFDLTGSGITTRQIAQSGVAPLSLKASGTYADGIATIGTADIRVGDGSLVASGTVGRTLDLDVTLNQVPVGLANGFVSGLGAQGTVSGTASATGSISDPDARFDISASNVSVAQSRGAGAPAIDATAAGTYAGGTLRLQTATANVGGGTINLSGSASATALAIDADIRNLPASIAAAAAPGIAPQGTINGTVRASGSPSNPSVTYDLNGSGLSIQQTRDAGVGALTVSANGQFANRIVTTTANLSGSGVDLAVSGSVNIAGTPQLDLSLNGTAPLSLANRILAEGGRSIQGNVQLNARVTGPASQPNVVGTLSTSGARFVDTGLNLAINDIAATIALNGQTATIQSFNASLSSGGTLSISGSVGLANGFPADIAIRLVAGRYNDGELVAAQLSAELTLTGPLAGTPLLAGTINADEINVLIPDKLPGSLARIDVTHRNAKPAVYEQQREINPNQGAGAQRSGINFNLTFNAPSRVFVRGRGLDVELGGSIVITGSAKAPRIVGGFELQRGRFVILGKRLDFDRGRLTFTGSLVPVLDLVARSQAGDTTVFIAVTGPANDPSFTFSSTPLLPQDEVLARLIFNQGTSDLSPLQIAQLAELAASLAGIGGSSGLLDNLRSQIGVDDLDIKTTKDGQTAVGVGKYLNENTYLGVDSTGRVAIDLDLGSGLKARGAVTATGGGEVGVFYEGEF